MKSSRVALPLLCFPLAVASCSGSDATVAASVDAGDVGDATSQDGGGHGDGASGADAGGVEGGVDGGTDSATDGAATGSIQTVFVILMENHSWTDIKGSASAPYINNTLLAMGAHAEQYFTPTGIHPSEPNYIWLEAGGNLGITDDSDPATNHKSVTDHLVTQLKTANISWKTYVEGIDGTTCPLTSSGLYAAKHTPMLFFDDVTNTNSTTSAYCIAHVRPFTELATDIASNSVPRYNFITPNLCHDMHGETLGTTCQSFVADLIKLGDDWLKTVVPTITASSAFRNGGALFIVWDEGSNNSDGPVPVVVLSPKAKAGFAGMTRYTHSSMLRSVERIFGVPYLRDAANAPDLGDLFTSFP